MAKTIKIVVDTRRVRRKLNDIFEKGEQAVRPAAQAGAHAVDLGRELFAAWRRNVKGAEEGAVTWL